MKLSNLHKMELKAWHVLAALAGMFVFGVVQAFAQVFVAAIL